MKSYRPERVGSMIRQVVSEAIAHRLNDPRIEPISSVTRVEVSGDLEHAKVYISVMGDAAAQRRTLRGLQSAGGRIQKMLGSALAIRQCPHLSFHLDESIKRGDALLRLIQEAAAEFGDQSPPTVDPADASDGQAQDEETSGDRA